MKTLGSTRPSSEPRSYGSEGQRPGRRAVYRERAAGVGYGNSSGYASARRYASGWTGLERFRCG